MAFERNEGRACDAVIQWLERRCDSSRHDLRWPESDGVGPPVELRLFISDTEYAIEHTVIETVQVMSWATLLVRATSINLPKRLLPVSRCQLRVLVHRVRMMGLLWSRTWTTSPKISST